MVGLILGLIAQRGWITEMETPDDSDHHCDLALTGIQGVLFHNL
ncbi:MAG: hypothetical protein U0T81_13545 [Saprospiraceae bacterium]